MCAGSQQEVSRLTQRESRAYMIHRISSRRPLLMRKPTVFIGIKRGLQSKCAFVQFFAL